jgi:hypothetical protein
MRMALAQGFLELETAMLASWMPGSHEHDDWRSNEPPAMPPMTASQALQLLYLHQKEARLLAEPDHIRKRRGESEEAYSARLSAMHEEWMRREREKFEVAEALRWERGEPASGPAGEAVRKELGLGPRFRGDEEGPSRRLCEATQDDPSIRCSAATQDGRSAFGLPDLAQVTGWSRADPAKVAHHPERALFGGWRIEDMTRAQSVRGD